MKEKLYTIEIIDAVKAGDECPFCFLERKLEQDAIAFVLGSSYMEPDIREQTDRQGICRTHTRMMFPYGNQLGNAWILKTRFRYLSKNLKTKLESSSSPSSSLFSKRKKVSMAGAWIREQESNCYICSRIRDTYDRMLDSFIYLLKHDPEFMTLIKESKGFCIHHLAEVSDACDAGLNGEEKAGILPALYSVMEQNLNRIQADIDWFIEKHDYCNEGADWLESKDAVPRTMQKIAGGHPSDPIFKKQ